MGNLKGRVSDLSSASASLVHWKTADCGIGSRREDLAHTNGAGADLRSVTDGFTATKPYAMVKKFYR